MSDVKAIWGFRTITAVEADLDVFLERMNFEARDRGIDPRVESDQLDLSRDLILTEAAAHVGALWEIEGDTLRLWRRDLTIDWSKVDA